MSSRAFRLAAWTERVRARNEALLRDTCTIKRMAMALTDNVAVETETTVATGVACRLVNRDYLSRVDEAELTETAVSLWTVKFAYDTDVRMGDILIISGHRFRVTGTLTHNLAHATEQTFEITWELQEQEVLIAQ